VRKALKCTIGGCGKTFSNRWAKDQHRRDSHGKPDKTRFLRASRHPMSAGDAYDFVDSLDLPDGAHWAMVEELSGAEPGDFA